METSPRSPWPRTIAALSLAPLLGTAVLATTCRVTAVREATAWSLLQAGSATLELASRVVVCADRGRFDTAGATPHALPPTSRKIPASVPRGDAIRTTAAEWEEPVFRCADFPAVQPQPFQLQWVKEPAASGSAETLDGGRGHARRHHGPLHRASAGGSWSRRSR